MVYSFPESDSLHGLQIYLRKMSQERGFDDETLSEKVMLLAEEAADVLMVLLDICNKLGIDLFRALQEKEKINMQRTWK